MRTGQPGTTPHAGITDEQWHYHEPRPVRRSHEKGPRRQLAKADAHAAIARMSVADKAQNAEREE
jgi:hypothetical protein